MISQRFYLNIFIAMLLWALLFSGSSYASLIEGTNTYDNYIFILVHGINSDASVFSDRNYGRLKSYLEKPVSEGGLGLAGRVFAYSFDKPNEWNKDHARELGDRSYHNPAGGMDGLCWLEKARIDFIALNPGKPVPTKYILITHSMGSLATSAYIYSDRVFNGGGFYRDDVAKVVFIAPTLYGSDMVYGSIKIWLQYIKQGVAGAGNLLSNTSSQPNPSLNSTFPSFTSNIVQSAYQYLLNIQSDPYHAYVVALDYSLITLYSDTMIRTRLGTCLNPLMGGMVDMLPYSPLVRTLQSAQLDDPTQEPAYSIVYGQGVPIFDGASTFAFHGMNVMYKDRNDADIQNSIKDLLLGNSNAGNSYSQALTGNLLKDIAGFNPLDFLKLDYQEATLFHPGFWSLSTSQAKFFSLLDSKSQAFFTLDGDGLVPTYSARGEGIAHLATATRYCKTFKSAEFNQYMDDLPGKVAAVELTIIAASAIDPAIARYGWVLRLCLSLDIISQVAANQNDLKEDLEAHSRILGDYDDITTAILDTPGVFTLYSLQCPVSIETEAVSEETKPMEFSVSGVVPANYEVIKVRSADENRAVANMPIQAVPSTLDDSRKYLTQVLVTKVPKRVTGKLNYLIPAKMRQFEYSFNFQAWQPVENVNNESGEFALDDLHFAEGQNLLAIRSINAVGVPYHQLMKIIVNTIPMQASRYMPESNFMTNNVYQPIGIEFNKSTYYADEAGKIQIVSFDMDTIDRMADSSITSEIDGAYHPYARVSYVPKEPLSDGEHAMVVKAKSDVGVSQAIWSFFVDTQPPTITIEALAPYSPRAPNAQPLSVRYKTADNLSTFLRSLTVKLYDQNGHYVTQIASYDTQAAGENYCSIDPTSLEGISDGIYRTKISAYDEAGNATTESTAMTIDTTPPTILEANISPKPMTSNSDTMNFNASLSENSIVTIKMINKSTGVASAYIAQATGADSAPLSAGGEPAPTGASGVASASYSWSYNSAYGSTGPEDGLYKLIVRLG